MKKSAPATLFRFLALTIFLLSWSGLPSAEAKATACPEPWKFGPGLSGCALSKITVRTYGVVTGIKTKLKVLIRNGYQAENPDVPFRGNVIYFQGLGDSMLNHQPLFSALTQAGFRVIAFDYMGQGGSTGSMNDTRVSEIGSIADQVWITNARDLNNFPNKTIVGWSTGGLAAYLETENKIDVDRVILIAPGISPKKFVGEQHFFRGEFNKITLASLTKAKYSASESDPHVDPIRPTSPLRVPSFAFDLLTTAWRSTSFPVRKQVRGLVLLSGDHDTYVNAESTRQHIKKYAPHFEVIQYHDSLHEIDNERPWIAEIARRDILQFLN